MFGPRKTAQFAKRGTGSTRPSTQTSAAPGKQHVPAPVKVILRVRPLNGREHNLSEVVDVVDTSTVIFDPKVDDEEHGHHEVLGDVTRDTHKNLQFDVDEIFTAEDNNNVVFGTAISGLVDKLLNGYNCTVFAYGATGSGKTFTVLGNQDSPGITPLLMQALWEKLASTRDLAYEVLISYLEVYNEKVRDLLMPGSRDLTLMDTGRDVIVADLTWMRPQNVASLMAILQRGNARRTQHPTDANAESSRSHALFQVKLKLKKRDEGGQKSSSFWVYLTMIDLAGSERAAATSNKDARFIEGANINKSLLSLGNCINALAEGQRHIPYRNSKLTRLLKGALGGNCSTIMIANISPSALSYEETYNTLKYAARARKIKNKVRKCTGKAPLAAELNKNYEAAQQTIFSLRAEVSELTVRSEVARNDLRERESDMATALRKVKTLLAAKESEALAKQHCAALQCQLESMADRSKQKNRKMQMLQNFGGMAEASQANLASVNEARAAKCAAIEKELNRKREAFALAEKFSRSVSQELDHWLKSCPKPLSELGNTIKQLVNIEANPDFVECTIEREYYKESLMEKDSEIEETHKTCALLAEIYTKEFKNMSDIKYELEKVKALVTGCPLPPPRHGPSTSRCDGESHPWDEASANASPQAFLLKNSPTLKPLNPTAQKSKKVSPALVPPAAFIFKTTPTKTSSSYSDNHTPPAISE